MKKSLWFVEVSATKSSWANAQVVTFTTLANYRDEAKALVSEMANVRFPWPEYEWCFTATSKA